MLTYLSGGARRYGEQPVRLSSRPFWEFQAVLAGAIAPTFPAGATYCGGEIKEETLWVFPPELEHGWTGEPGTTATVAVFHFDAIPEPAAAFIRREGFLAVRPDRSALDRIGTLRGEMTSSWEGRDTLALLRSDAAGLELSIIALEALGPGRTAALIDRAELVAAGSQAWFSEHMAEAPSVGRIARKMNCSESHFRRLFVRARGVPPQEAFEAQRIGRAMHLLKRREHSIKEIADLCGYASQSCFSRAFRRAAGSAPRDYPEQRIEPESQILSADRKN